MLKSVADDKPSNAEFISGEFLKEVSKAETVPSEGATVAASVLFDFTTPTILVNIVSSSVC